MRQAKQKNNICKIGGYEQMLEPKKEISEMVCKEQEAWLIKNMSEMAGC